MTWLRRKGWIAVAIMASLPVSLALLPTIASHFPPLRNYVLSQLTNDVALRASCERMSIGWVTPLRLDQVHVVTEQGIRLCDIESVTSSVRLWNLLQGERDLGTIRVEGSVLHIHLGEGVSTWEALRKRNDLEGQGSSPGIHFPSGRFVWRVELVKSRLLVSENQATKPLADLQGVDVRVALQTTPSGEHLRIELPHPIESIPLTPELCDIGIKYIAPVLAAATWTRGTIGLTITQCDIPLDTPRLAAVAGELSLREVASGLRDGPIRAAANTLASHTGRELPEEITLARDQTVPFQIHDGRVFHSNLAIGLPSLSDDLLLTSDGSVGLDETLDLQIELPLPFSLLGSGPFARALGNQRLHIPVTGTLDQPRIEVRGDGRLASDILASWLGSSTGQSSGEIDATSSYRTPSGRQTDALGTADPNNERQLPTNGDTVDRTVEQVVDLAEELAERIRRRRDAARADGNASETGPLRRLLRGRRRETVPESEAPE